MIRCLCRCAIIWLTILYLLGHVHNGIFRDAHGLEINGKGPWCFCPFLLGWSKRVVKYFSYPSAPPVCINDHICIRTGFRRWLKLPRLLKISKQINNHFFQIYTYGMLNQIATETGTQPYLNGRTKLILKNAFSPETFKIQILEEIYCSTKWVNELFANPRRNIL